MKIARNTLITFVLLYLMVNTLTWILSPWLVRTFAADTLIEHNISMDSNSTVRLNLFNSSLKISTVKLLQAEQVPYQLEQLQLHYSFWRLFKKEIVIERIYLNGMTLSASLQGDKIVIAGFDLDSFTQTPQSDEQEVPAREEPTGAEPGFVDTLSYLAPEILLENININLSNEGHFHQININQLAIVESEYRNQNLMSSMALDAVIDGASVKLNADVSVIADTTQTDISLDIGEFNTALYDYLLPAEINQLDVILNTHLTMNVSLQGEQISVNSSALTLNLKNLAVSEAIYQASLQSFDLNVPKFSAQMNLEGTKIQGQGLLQLELNGLHAGLSDSDIILSTLEQLSTSDLNVSFDMNQDELDYNLTGAKIELTGLVSSKVSEQLPALFKMQSMQFNQFAVTPELVTLENFNLGSGLAYIILDQDYNVDTLFDTNLLLTEEELAQAITQLEVSTSESETTMATTVETLNPEESEMEVELLEPRIQIGSITLNEPLNIQIEDYSTKTPFNKMFILTSVLIEDIDSSELNKQTRYHLKFADEGYFKGEAVGWIKPFTEKLNLDTKITLREFPLHEVAPYLKDSLGFEITAGQMDFDFGGNINDDNLLSDAVILMRGAKFGTSDKVEGSNLIGKTAIPLNVALGMLRDKNGNIELKIPVNGDVYDPSFGVSSIVGLVLKKVVMAQAKSYLLNAFVPYAKVVQVALDAGELALKVRFADLEYTAGQIQTDEAQSEYINQITALLTDKDSVVVRVCPVATKADLVGYVEIMEQAINNDGSTNNDTIVTTDALANTSEQSELITPAQSDASSQTESIIQVDDLIQTINLDQQDLPITDAQYAYLINIAKLRGEAFKAKLVELGNIESSRLLLCSPKLDEKKKGQPRIEFGT